MNYFDACRIVLEDTECDYENVYLKGYAWFRDRFTPAFRIVDRRANVDAGYAHENAGPANALLGDVYGYLFHIPRVAERYYRRSLRLQSNVVTVVDDLANVLSWQDKWGSLRNVCQIMRRVDPENYTLELYATELQSGQNENRELNEELDLPDLVHEQLARHRPRVGLDMLAKKRGVNARQLRAQAWGALGDD